MKLIGMEEMDKIFAVTDACGLSRERITIPVIPHGAGSVEIVESGRVQIVLPSDRPLDEWLPTLRARLGAIKLP
jgi:hypothetical protein